MARHAAAVNRIRVLLCDILKIWFSYVSTSLLSLSVRFAELTGSIFWPALLLSFVTFKSFHLFGFTFVHCLMLLRLIGWER